MNTTSSMDEDLRDDIIMPRSTALETISKVLERGRQDEEAEVAKWKSVGVALCRLANGRTEDAINALKSGLDEAYGRWRDARDD